MFNFYRSGMTAVLILTGLCLAVPGWGAVNTIAPDSGQWTVEINAPKASVSIKGLEQPFSSVQVTVYYQNQEGLSSQQTFPVHVLFLKKAEITPEKEGFQVKQIIFVCTRGKVEIDARPDGFSGTWQ